MPPEGKVTCDVPGCCGKLVTRKTLRAHRAGHGPILLRASVAELRAQKHPQHITSPSHHVSGSSSHQRSDISTPLVAAAIPPAGCLSAIPPAGHPSGFDEQVDSMDIDNADYGQAEVNDGTGMLILTFYDQL